jgi:hypothetical protein
MPSMPTPRSAWARMRSCAATEPLLRRVATSLLAVEARHATFFNGLAGPSPFPQAREGAASPLASLLVIDRYRLT